jgi:hypothetical protein
LKIRHLAADVDPSLPPYFSIKTALEKSLVANLVANREFQRAIQFGEC